MSTQDHQMKHRWRPAELICACGDPQIAYEEHPKHVADAWKDHRTIHSRVDVDRLPPEAVLLFSGADHIVAVKDMCCAGCYDLPALILYHPDEDGTI